MSPSNKFAAALELIEHAQASLRSAKALIAEVGGITPQPGGERHSPALAGDVPGKIIEGVFDGQNMVGPDKRTYPVPANYASKSKLVQGDVLKLTITDNGSFIYKQISPIPRLVVVGTVTFDEGQYKIVVDGKPYRVLMASITFYKAEVGQRVSILLPEGIEAEWATIDNMLPEHALGAEAAEAEEPAAEAAAPAEPKKRKKKATDEA